MQILSIITFIFILIIGFMPYSCCLASNSEIELYNAESRKQRQEIAPLSFSSAPYLLETGQWDTLAEELVMRVFDHLSFRELGKVKMVCKKWQRIGADDFFSLSKQFSNKPLYVLLNKLQESSDGRDGLYQEFFTFPEALHKVLSDSIVLGEMLSNSSLIPFLFESQITAATVYEALHRTALSAEQQTALETYVKAAPIFPPEESIFSQAFVEFAQTYASHYKALYLLALFNLSSGRPIKNLLKRINQKIELEDVYIDKKECEAILLPKAMAYFPNIPRKKVYNLAHYCYEWAEQSTTNTLKDEWLRFAELFLRESARQGDAEAQFELTLLLEEQGKLEECEEILLLDKQDKLNKFKDTLLFFADQGSAEAQCTLALHYEYRGKYDKAESYYRQAAHQSYAKAQFHLGLLLQNQGKIDEAEVCYYEAARQGYVPAQNNLGFCLEKKGDFLGALRNYERAVKQGHKVAYLNLAYLFEQHPEVFQGSQEERLKQITQLRSQGKERLEDWLKTRD